MLDWHSCQICYPLEIKILLLLLLYIRQIPVTTPFGVLTKITKFTRCVGIAVKHK